MDGGTVDGAVQDAGQDGDLCGTPDEDGADVRPAIAGSYEAITRSTSGRPPGRLTGARRCARATDAKPAPEGPWPASGGSARHRRRGRIAVGGAAERPRLAAHVRDVLVGDQFGHQVLHGARLSRRPDVDLGRAWAGRRRRGSRGPTIPEGSESAISTPRGRYCSRARADRSWSCSRCMRSWTPAKSSHSPQRSRPTSGWWSGQRSSLVAVDHCRAAALDQALALVELRGRARRGRRRPGRGCPARPSVHPPASDPRPRAPPQAPVRLARRRRDRPPRRRSSRPPRRAARMPSSGSASTTPRSAAAVAASWLDRARRGARARPAPDLPADAEELPLVDAAPGGDDVGCGRLELVDPEPGDRHRWPFAIFVASGRPRSRHIATIPTAGPSASMTQKRSAIRRRRSDRAAPTPRIVTPVRMKPIASCNDSADPAVPGGASSETAAENWAESAMTVRPQTSADDVDHRGRRTEQEPDDERGRAAPGHRRDRQRRPPEPVGEDAGDDAADAADRDDGERRQRWPRAGSSTPAAANDAARNSGSHVHIAYSSHMWPR